MKDEHRYLSQQRGYRESRRGTICRLEGCTGVCGAHHYCLASQGFRHAALVDRLGIEHVTAFWQHQLVEGWATVQPLSTRFPVGLYGLIVPTGGKFGKTSRKFEHRWSDYKVPFLPFFTTGYSQENHGVEYQLRQLIKDTGQLVRGHEWTTTRGLLDVLKFLEDSEDVFDIAKAWVPSPSGVLVHNRTLWAP